MKDLHLYRVRCNSNSSDSRSFDTIFISQEAALIDMVKCKDLFPAYTIDLFISNGFIKDIVVWKILVPGVDY